MHLYATRLLALSPTIINLLSARVCPRLALSCCVCRPLQGMRSTAAGPETRLQLGLGRRHRRLEPHPERRLALLNPQHPGVEADRDPGAALLCTLPLPFAALGPADDKTISLTQPSIQHKRVVLRQGGLPRLGQRRYVMLNPRREDQHLTLLQLLHHLSTNPSNFSEHWSRGMSSQDCSPKSTPILSRLRPPARG